MTGEKTPGAAHNETRMDLILATARINPLRCALGRGTFHARRSDTKGHGMRALLAVSRLIDAVNNAVGRGIAWLILLDVLISSGNATVRYIFDESSNAWLEAQWYLFSAVFLLCAGYTLLRNEHIRIDILTGRCSAKVKAWIDILGALFFLLPTTLLIMTLSWPMFLDSFNRHEMSSNAGGLLRWPVKLLIPIAFLLLALQAISEIIRRVAFLTGHAPPPTTHAAHAPLETIEAEEHAV